MKKITWEFNDGEKVTVEVEDEIGEVIIESRREEENLERKERYHCLSYDAAAYEGKDYATALLEDDFDNEEIAREMYEMIYQLPSQYKRRLLMFVEGNSTYDIAEMEGVNHSAPYKTIVRCRKMFEKFL